MKFVTMLTFHYSCNIWTLCSLVDITSIPWEVEKVQSFKLLNLKNIFIAISFVNYRLFIIKQQKYVS